MRNETVKTVCVYTPYDLVPGGGERYMLTIAEYFISSGCEVFLVLEEVYSRLRLKQMQKELGLSFEGIRIITYKDAFNSYKGKFDIFITVDNSLIPLVLPHGRLNFYICQFPFPQDEMWIEENRINFYKYDEVIVYSDFVLNNYKKLLKKYNLPDIPIKVVYPPCGFASASDLIPSGLIQPEFTGSLTDKITILTVGRFFTEGHCKRQDFLIESFIEMVDKYSLDGVEFHIAGSIHPTKDGRDYFTRLQEIIKDRKDVYLYGNIEVAALKELYDGADIYWHAAGINVNSTEHPEMLEHFGITIVEAMASGCIPIVINKGGPAEIVRDGIDGFCFNSKSELIGYSLRVIRTIQDMNQKEAQNSLRKNAIDRALKFTKERFYENIGNLL